MPTVPENQPDLQDIDPDKLYNIIDIARFLGLTLEKTKWIIRRHKAGEIICDTDGIEKVSGIIALIIKKILNPLPHTQFAIRPDLNVDSIVAIDPIEIAHTYMTASYLYFIFSPPHFVKIGITDNLSGRIAILQTGNPYQITLLGNIPFETKEDAESAERSLHIRFANILARGEWFILHDELRAFINQYLPDAQPILDSLI